MMKNDEQIYYLICNKWRCKDGTILHSKHRHDFIQYTDANGEYYLLDGGVDYIRHSGNMESLCIYSNDSHDKIRDNFEWTSYGKTGNEPAKTQLIKELDTEHIEAIVKTQNHLPKYILDVFRNELKFRKKRGKQ